MRAAARAWHRAGAIDRATIETIRAEYADDRARMRPAFRVLLFLFTLLAGGAAFGLLVAGRLPLGGALFIMAIGCAALTEIQVGELRRSNAGAEEATALLFLVFSYAELVWASETSGGELPWRLLLAAIAVLAAAAAFRWGISLFGTVSAICLFAALAFWPLSRLVWFLLGAALAPPLAALSVSPALAPSHRRAADAALVVALTAVYASIHLGSYDGLVLEGAGLFGRVGTPPPTWARWIFIAATALVPPAVLAFGILGRRPLLLRTGLLFGAASLVTLRFYVHVAPLWVILTASGALAIAAGLLLERYLRTGHGRERGGFTAEPLYGGESAALETGLSAALAPVARAPSSGGPRFESGGGNFGGGGASGAY